MKGFVKRLFLLLINCLSIVSTYSVASSSVTMTYDGIPLEIAIPVGKEIKLQFTEPQVVAMDSYYLNNVVNPLSTSSQVLLSGKKEADNVRVIFQGVNTRSVVIANVKVCNCENLPTVYLIDNKQAFQNSSSQSAQSNSKKKKSTSNDIENMQILLRYINQQTGPKEAIETPFFKITKLSERLNSQVVGLYRQAKLDTYINDVYQGGGLTAITIIAKNVSDSYVPIDPSMIRGKWLGIQPWKKGLKPEERGVFVLVAKGDMPEGMLAVLSGAEL